MMNHKLIFKIVFFTLLFQLTKGQNIVYVNAGASVSGNGSSWSNAYNSLSSALKSAPSGAQIWVAKGIYSPVAPDTTFKIERPLQLIGGFEGNETSLQQRKPEIFVSVLSGERGTADDSDNLSVILWASHLKDSLIIDGFTFEKSRIRRGNYLFAGLTLHSTKTRIENCIFENKMTQAYASKHIFADTAGIVIRHSKFINNISDYSDLIHTLSNDLTIDHCLFENNINDGFGIINYDGIGSILTVRNSTFRNNNKAEIHINADYAIFDSCLFENHTKPRTYLIYVSGTDSLVVNNSKFLNNSTGSPLIQTGKAILRNTVFRNGDDNAIYQYGDTLTTFHCVFDNFKGQSGGAIYCNVANFNDTRFINNTGGMGGAVYSQGVTAKNCLFENNKAGYAGGLYSSGIFQLSQCIFKNNISGSQGGAFFGSKGGVKNSRFENNITRYTGGAVVTWDSSVFQSSVFINNGIPDTSVGAPSSYGGAIYCGGRTWVYNSLFIKNSAHNGAALQAGGRSLIANSTFYNNISPVDSSQGAFSHADEIEIVSSIFWNPGMDELFSDDNDKEVVSHSVFKDDISGTEIVFSEPLLNEEGIPQQGSPGNDLGILTDPSAVGTLDVYGNRRVKGKSIDIGAVEFQDNVTETTEFAGGKNLAIYPNPVLRDGIIHIPLDDNAGFKYIEIMDHTGNKILKETLSNDHSTVVKTLSPGAYMILLKDENNILKKGRFVVY